MYYPELGTLSIIPPFKNPVKYTCGGRINDIITDRVAGACGSRANLRRKISMLSRFNALTGGFLLTWRMKDEGEGAMAGDPNRKPRRVQDPAEAEHRNNPLAGLPSRRYCTLR
jgi:hypothetical protein